MYKKIYSVFQKSRIVSQILFVILFFYLFFFFSGSTSLFFYFDPLIMILNFFSSGTILPIFLLSLITILLALIFGRFFCGWICPFGAINQFFSWLLKKYNKKNEVLDKRFLKVKYLILLAVLVSATMGANLGTWLDPFSILTRSSAAILSPINYLINHSLESGNSDIGVISKAIKPINDFAKQNILNANPHYSAQSILIPGLLFFFILMNYYKRRFFCNTLCPLGALLGMFARIGLFKIKSSSNCTSCKMCSGNCTYNGNPDDDYMKSECLVCFNCTVDCSTKAIEVGFELPQKKNRTKINIGRRKLVGAAISGLVIAALPKSSIEAKPKGRHSFLRPPGSIEEKEFLSKCARCGNCVQVCPTSFIQPATIEAGIEALWTPILNAEVGSCNYNCNKCTQVCSTGAIEKISLKEKQKFKIGTAIVDKNRCYTYSNGFNCSVCFDNCPTPQKAIGFNEVEAWGFQGKYSFVKQIYIFPDLCIGCGICENVCPRKDAPGIIITSEDEVRESVTGDI